MTSCLLFWTMTPLQNRVYSSILKRKNLLQEEQILFFKKRLAPTKIEDKTENKLLPLKVYSANTEKVNLYESLFCNFADVNF